jgi:hypothetical protein
MRIALMLILTLAGCAQSPERNALTPSESRALDNAAAKLDGPPPAQPPR